MKVTLLGLLGLATLSTAHIHRDYENNDYYVLHLDQNTHPDGVASRLGMRHEGQLSTLDGHHIFSTTKHEHDVVRRQLHERRRTKRDIGGYDVLDGVRISQKQKARMMSKREIPSPPKGYYPRQEDPQAWAAKNQKKLMATLGIADPIFHDQWHLYNTVQIGHDVNVTNVWLEGVTGKNATVAIVDDGLDMHSKDLKDNYFAEGSWDFNDNDPEPAPELAADTHGTRCAGEVSAVKNDICGIGVAYNSKIAGIRILSKPISDMDEAAAMIYKYDHNQIYSCSWGPPDDGRSMEAPGLLIRRAMLTGIQKGRGGLGSVYVFASGNGAASDDNCNFDGYTNSIYSITVGAVDRAGNHPYYSELCSAQLVVTYSSGAGDTIHTTDVGENNCATNHGGTSAAAPLAAGIFALVMEVRPDLTWRDMQYLALETAVKVQDKDAEWQKTSIGKHFSHTYGYGKVDSYSIVQMAKTWDKVKPQAWYFSPWLHIRKDIPEGKDGLVATFEVTEEMLKEANLARLEHVTVTMNVEHTRRGDLSVDLISPDNIISHIATARKNDEYKAGYEDWTFMSVVHWGERGVGKWTIIVRDTVTNGKTGKFVDWHLKLWGESIDASKAKLLPMPTEKDDEDHDKDIPVVTTTAAVTSLPSPEASAPEPAEGNPSDHPERPTKPTEHEASTKPASSWVSWLPTFGASKKAQIWIYGAIGLIGAFCTGLAVYFYLARRRRLRESRNNYDFELIDEEEGEGLSGAEKGAGKRTRGGELYDAFADGSDDELDDDDDDEYDAYRDRSAEKLAGIPGERDGEQAEHHVIGGDSDDESDREVVPLRR